MFSNIHSKLNKQKLNDVNMHTGHMVSGGSERDKQTGRTGGVEDVTVPPVWQTCGGRREFTMLLLQHY